MSACAWYAHDGDSAVVGCWGKMPIPGSLFCNCCRVSQGARQWDCLKQLATPYIGFTMPGFPCSSSAGSSGI